MPPLFLLADSRPLFDPGGVGPELARALALVAPPGVSVRAAYLGASNGDRPEFYQVFVAAMERLGLADTRHVPADPSADDLAWLATARIVLLAGGDVDLGWSAFERSGLHAAVMARYAAGAIVLGVSAGAIQLGRWHGREVHRDAERAAPMFSVAPAAIDVHDEPDWGRLRALVSVLGAGEIGIGIPSGGALLVREPEQPLEPIGRAVTVFRRVGSTLEQTSLQPLGHGRKAAT